MATKQKLLQTKEQRGVVTVSKINRSHPEYCKYVPVPENRKKKYAEKAAASAAAASAAAAGAAAAAEDTAARGTETAAKAAASSSGPLVFEYCAPPAKCCRIFAAVGARTGKNIFFTAEEYRQVLTKYLELQNTKKEDGEGKEAETSGPPAGGPLVSGGKATVVIDPLLAEAVLTKEERGDAKAGGEDKMLMEKGEVFIRWQDTAQACHAVLRDESELPLLQERIVNTTNYLVDPKILAEFLQKKLAASASLYAPPGCKVTNAVCVQGNMAKQVADLVTSTFGIPKKFVEVELKKQKPTR
ncbi:Gm12258, related, related [Eimeria brunetti]|uniref:Gm12258, related, related n=1 Tax=Eimeria brunetti TaxID=51314 RepID=U6LID9_9EIME|nr:Gm12258, related, related [Eimeria brunetti]